MIFSLFKQTLSDFQKGKNNVMVTVYNGAGIIKDGTKFLWQGGEEDAVIINLPASLSSSQDQLRAICQDFWQRKKAGTVMLSLEEKKEIGLFVQPVLSGPSLVILGGGHIAAALAPMAQLLGFLVTIVDDRADFAHPERFPGARVLCLNFEKAFQDISFSNNTYIAIVTRGHKHDALCLEHALKTPACYIGMIGSKRKVQMVKDNIINAGYSPKDLNRVYAPVGLPIGAQTPSEIAVSILAEIIAVKYGVSLIQQEVTQDGC